MKRNPSIRKVLSHLKGDIKMFKHESDEDKELIGSLRKKKKAKKKSSKTTKRDKKLMKVGRKEDKIETVMHEFKEKKLHSGSKRGPKVTNPKQAIAIALSSARRVGKRKKKSKSSKK